MSVADPLADTSIPGATSIPAGAARPRTRMIIEQPPGERTGAPSATRMIEFKLGGHVPFSLTASWSLRDSPCP